jgi:nicotinamidase-related amidase
MATVRPGDRSALIVIDVQAGVMASAWDAPRILGNVESAVRGARQAQVPVIWVQHSDDELVEGSAPWQWAPPLAPAPAETVVAKSFNSAFEQTDLDVVLDREGVSHLVVAGAETNWCIRATAYGAVERGYDLTLVGDAHTAVPVELGDGRTLDVAGIVEDLNVCFSWVRYPGRATTVTAAAALTFRPPAPAPG